MAPKKKVKANKSPSPSPLPKPLAIFEEHGTDLWATFHTNGFTTLSVIARVLTNEMIEEWEWETFGAKSRAHLLLEDARKEIAGEVAIVSKTTTESAVKRKRTYHCTCCHMVLPSLRDHIAKSGVHICEPCPDYELCHFDAGHRTGKKQRSQSVLAQSRKKEYDAFLAKTKFPGFNEVFQEKVKERVKAGLIPQTSRELSVSYNEIATSVREEEKECNLVNQVKSYLKKKIGSMDLHTTQAKLDYAQEHLETFIQLGKQLQANPGLAKTYPDLAEKCLKPARLTPNIAIQVETKAQFDEDFRKMFFLNLGTEGTTATTQSLPGNPSQQALTD